MRVSERIYRLCLRLYPREFRDEYGGEMALLFRARAHEGRVMLWLQVVGDLLFHAPREHWSMAKQDVRYALRSWRRAPAIPAIALTALTFGMGANVAIFSVVHAVLLSPLPIPEPDDLMHVQETSAARGLDSSAVSLPNYLSWRERARSLDLAAFSSQTLTWMGPEYPERLTAVAPTASFFTVMSAPLHHGRWFTPEEEHAGRHRVAVLSDRFWRTRFGADPGVIGREIVLNGGPYSVIGVASAAFVVPSEPDLWVPQVVDQPASQRGNRYLGVLGRLRPAFSRDQAQAEMTAIAAALAQEFPESNKDYGIRVTPLAHSLVPSEIRTALMALLAASGLVLLIACANVANVLLTRAAARRKEMAIRAALGAGVVRLTRQLLTESLLLSLAGMVSGVLLSLAIVAAARGVLVDLVPRAEAVSLDGVVLAFALGLAVTTGLAFGLAPLGHGRSGGLDVLRAGGRDDRTPARHGVRRALVVAEIALTTLLLVGAGLLMQSLARLQRVPAGVNADSVLTAKLSLTRARLPNGTAISAFLSRLTGDLRSAPGIGAAGVSSAIPLSPGAYTITQAAAETDPFVTVEWRLVDEGYFRTFQIPLVRGRLFGAEDTVDAPRVFLISQQTARALYGEADPLGRRLRLENGTSGEVVGVIADVRMRNLGDPPERVVYIPPAQFGFFPLFNVVLRTGGPPEAAVAVVRDRLKALDPNLAAFEIRSMQHWVDRSAALMRIRTRLIAALGALALLLGVVGIYGVVSSLVTQRTHEFGVRIALGARPWALPLAVVREGLREIAAGIALGLLAAALLVDRVRTLLFEVDPGDPVTFGGAALIVAAVALAASYVPARRAANADPLVVLRAE